MAEVRREANNPIIHSNGELRKRSCLIIRQRAQRGTGRDWSSPNTLAIWDYNVIPSLTSVPFRPPNSPIYHAVFSCKFMASVFVNCYIYASCAYIPKYSLFGLYSITCMHTPLELTILHCFFLFGQQSTRDSRMNVSNTLGRKQLLCKPLWNLHEFQASIITLQGIGTGKAGPISTSIFLTEVMSYKKDQN